MRDIDIRSELRKRLCAPRECDSGTIVVEEFALREAKYWQT